MMTGDNPETAAGEAVPRPPADAAPRYAAFISYSHTDEAAAKALHKRLETYRLPSRVRDAPDATRIGTIFRDRADLAAASDLTDSIKAALADSAALIVLCSPEARASLWVDAEIRLFRELHPAAPILAVILRGEPAEGMPPSLVEGGREPLAADFRKEGDGTKLGFLKVVAALKGLPLDSLIQRDAQRRLRRVIAVTVIAVTLMLAMLGMTAYAISARNEAQHQRAEAEGLIDYMLTDLRTRLRGVGNTDVMSAVNDRAMDYYRNQDLSTLPADSLRRRAMVLQAMGEDESAQGRDTQALERFTEAHRSTRVLLDLDAADPDRIFAHAQSEYWIGYVSQKRRRYAAARQHFAAYRSLAADLAAVDTDRDRADRELGYAEGNLCTVEILDEETDRPPTPHCSVALSSMRRVALRRPDDPAAQLALANRHAWLSLALGSEGRTDEEIDQLVLANRITAQLLEVAPDNADYMDMLAGNLVRLADRELDRSRSSAGATLRDADIIIQKLTSRDPQRVRWRYLRQELNALQQRYRDGASN